MVLEEDDKTENLSGWMLKSEDVRERARKFVRANSIRSGDGEQNLTVDAFHIWVNTELLPSLAGSQSVHDISRSTAHAWLRKLGSNTRLPRRESVGWP